MEKRDKADKEKSRDQKAKRKYERPEILSEEIFETTALACGKIAGQGGRCNARPRAS